MGIEKMIASFIRIPNELGPLGGTRSAHPINEQHIYIAPSDIGRSVRQRTEHHAEQNLKGSTQIPERRNRNA